MKKYSRKELIEAINRQKDEVTEAGIYYKTAVYEITKCVASLEKLTARIKTETADMEEFQRVLFARKKILAQLEAQLTKLNNAERKRK